MFSGIIEEIGRVRELERKENLYVLTMEAKEVFADAKIGDSICHDGVCLTITSIDEKKCVATYDLMKETIDKTNFRTYGPGTPVNLERALRANDRLGGHFVSGHVDDTGKLEKIVRLPNYVEFQITASPDIMQYIAPKGSVALDGISLTIGEVRPDGFSVYLIPHTLKVTTFGTKQEGDVLNIETDILAKYVLKAKASSPYSAEKTDKE